MKKKLIGLCGLAESGKSTAARLLGGEVISFAKPLKDMLATFGLTDAQLYGDQKFEPCDLLGGKTPRHAMQTLGTEWGREAIYPSIWTDAWKRRVLASESSVVICDDVRFGNEVELIRSMGGVVIAIQRDAAGRAGSHPSEGLDYTKYSIPVVRNNGTLMEFADALDRALDNVLGQA